MLVAKRATAIAMPSDPRVFFASERTLLAWLRTGIAIIGLGFVVSRFGLFMRLLAAQVHPGHAAAPSGYSNILGVCLVAIGAVSITAAAVQHGRFIATLPEQDRPTHYAMTWSVWFAAVIAAVAAALAFYLAYTPGEA